MGFVQARGRAVILHAQPEFAALGVGETGQCLHQLVIVQAVAVALELDFQRFALWQFRGRLRACRAHAVFPFAAFFTGALLTASAVIFVYSSNSFSSRSVSFLKRRPM